MAPTGVSGSPPCNFCGLIVGKFDSTTKGIVLPEILDFDHDRKIYVLIKAYQDYL